MMDQAGRSSCFPGWQLPYRHLLKQTDVVTVRCVLAPGVAGGGDELLGQTGVHWRHSQPVLPFEPPSDCAILPQQFSSSDTAPDAQHAICKLQGSMTPVGLS